MRILLVVLFSTLSFSSFVKASDGGFHGVLSYNIGMISFGVTENESTLVATDPNASTLSTTGEATAVSAISFKLDWEFKTVADKSYFAKVIVPMMAPDGTGVFMGGVGINWYLNGLGTKYTINKGGSRLSILPNLRYYWGLNTGIGYIVYNTVSAKKSDVFFDLGLHGGAVYGFGSKWGLKGEIGASRATGVATTGIKIVFLAGATYYL